MILHARVRDIQLRKISSEIAIEYCSFISRQKQLATAYFLKLNPQASSLLFKTSGIRGCCFILYHFIHERRQNIVTFFHFIIAIAF